MESPSRSGVFAKGIDQRLAQFSESISFDHRLYQHDIRGSIAHARMLAQQKILTQEEFSQIESALQAIGEQIAAGEMVFRPELEDIHMHIEQALIDRLGDTGRKLHTGRSRNDQVSTDIRLWMRDALDRIDLLVAELMKAFLDRCHKDNDVVLPAYTHMQRAQPVLAPHYWLAYLEKYARDRQRLADCRKRLNISPLGGAAVAGTTIPIDRQATAAELGFEGIAANSIDISSDRDFALETVFVLAMISEHLSGWAEEWILWSTTEFRFLKIPQQFCTGSSIMPQKVNPDTLELIRGKTARVVGSLNTLLVLIKGLPLAYNRDLQEDKPPIFDAFDTVEACLELAIPIVRDAELRAESIASQLDAGYLDATTVMEHLILQGMPQRTAHHLVGGLVALASDENKPIGELSDQQILSISQEIDPENLRSVCGATGAIHAFRSLGSTAPKEVEKQIQRWEVELQ